MNDLRQTTIYTTLDSRITWICFIFPLEYFFQYLLGYISLTDWLNWLWAQFELTFKSLVCSSVESSFRGKYTFCFEDSWFGLVWSSLNKFDPIWKSLIQFKQVWSISFTVWKCKLFCNKLWFKLFSKCQGVIFSTLSTKIHCVEYGPFKTASGFDQFVNAHYAPFKNSQC